MNFWLKNRPKIQQRGLYPITVTQRFSYVIFLIIILAKKLPIIGYSLSYVVTEFNLSPETLVKVPSLNTQFSKKMKNQGFHISSLSLQASLTALLLIAGNSTLVSNQVKASPNPILTAQAPATATVIYVNSATLVLELQQHLIKQLPLPCPKLNQEL
ncbi:MAG: Cellulosome-anchoring protein [Cyanobacteriota bacterium]